MYFLLKLLCMFTSTVLFLCYLCVNVLSFETAVYVYQFCAVFMLPVCDFIFIVNYKHHICHRSRMKV